MEAIIDSHEKRLLRKLKVGKAADPDGIVGEHLKWGGAVVQEY